MRLEQLSILHYKNITQCDLHFSPKINCFIGTNGAGKTNLLDAIYYLAFSKSASQPIDAQVIQHTDDFMLLQAQLQPDREDAPVELYYGIKRKHKKQVKCNGVLYKKISDHIGTVPLVLIAPSDSLLIAGGSEEKRNFLDTVIAQYDKVYLQSMIQYNSALQQRNALLKAEQAPDTTVLDIYEDIMATHGTYIYQQREAFVQAFKPYFHTFHRMIAGTDEPVEIDYTSHGSRGDLLATLRAGRDKDRIMGYSLHGVHKDDLQMLLRGFPIKREGSQGQNKTLLIALKLAQYHFLTQCTGGERPILLLDDIFDKLDADRVSRIIEVVSQSDFGQIFITDTNREQLDRIIAKGSQQYQIFTIVQGEVYHEKD